MDPRENLKSGALWNQDGDLSFSITPRDFVPQIEIDALDVKKLYHSEDEKGKMFSMKSYYDKDGKLLIRSHIGEEMSVKLEKVRIKVFRADCLGEVSFTHKERDLTVKDLPNKRNGERNLSVTLRHFICVGMKYYKNISRHFLHLNFEFLFPSFYFKLTKVSGLGIEDSDFYQYMRRNGRSSRISTGYLNITQRRKLRLLMHDDREHLTKVAICGIWLKDCDIRSVEFISIAIRYVLMKSFKKKVYNTGKSFLILHFNERSQPVFYNCQLLGNKDQKIRYSILSYRAEVNMWKTLEDPLVVEFDQLRKNQPRIYTYPLEKGAKNYYLKKNVLYMSLPMKQKPPRITSVQPKISLGMPVHRENHQSQTSSNMKHPNPKYRTPPHRRRSRPRSLPNSPARPPTGPGNTDYILGKTLNLPSSRSNQVSINFDDGSGGKKGQNKLYTSNSKRNQLSWEKCHEIESKYPHRFPVSHVAKPNSFLTVESVYEEFAKVKNIMVSNHHERMNQEKEVGEKVNLLVNEVACLKTALEDTQKTVNNQNSEIKSLKEQVRKDSEEKRELIECVKDLLLNITLNNSKFNRNKNNNHQKKKNFVTGNRMFYHQKDQDQDQEREGEEQEQDQDHLIVYTKDVMMNSATSVQLKKKTKNHEMLNRRTSSAAKERVIVTSTSSSNHQHQHHRQNRRNENNIQIRKNNNHGNNNKMMIMKKKNRRSSDEKKKKNEKSILPLRTTKIRTDHVLFGIEDLDDDNEDEEEEEEEEVETTRRAEDNNFSKKRRKRKVVKKKMYGKRKGRIRSEEEDDDGKMSMGARSDISSPSSTTFANLPKIRVGGGRRGVTGAESTASSYVDEDDEVVNDDYSSENGFKSTAMSGLDYDDEDDDIDDDDDELSVY